MGKLVFNWIFKTVVGRWVTAIIVTSLLGGAALKWHNFKEDLVHKGQQVCVQEINKQTVIDLQNALAEERATVTRLQELATAAAEENELARDRREALETQVTDLERAMAEQARTDDEYKEWGDTPLPTGVAARLRDQAAGGHTSAIREDSN